VKGVIEFVVLSPWFCTKTRHFLHVQEDGNALDQRRTESDRFSIRSPFMKTCHSGQTRMPSDQLGGGQETGEQER